jgi:AraC-like DNA-binding protein
MTSVTQSQGSSSEELAAWLHFVDRCQVTVGRAQLTGTVDSALIPTLLEAAGNLRTHASRLLSRTLLLRIVSRLDNIREPDRNAAPLAPVMLPEVPGEAPVALDRRVLVLLDRIFTGRVRHRSQLTETARSLRVSPSYLSRLVVSQTGMTFKRHLQVAKMGESARLLDESELSVKEIAAAMGYEHVPSFDRQFRRYFHVTPSEYRRYVRRTS